MLYSQQETCLSDGNGYAVVVGGINWETHSTEIKQCRRNISESYYRAGETRYRITASATTVLLRQTSSNLMALSVLLRALPGTLRRLEKSQSFYIIRLFVFLYFLRNLGL